MRSGKLAAWASGRIGVRFARWRLPRRPRTSSRNCSAASPARASSLISQMPFADDDGQVYAPRGEGRVRYSGGGGGQAFCVRTCDGRYFPVTASDNASRAASCNSFCPASETKVFSGSSIDNATAENGKSYSDLPNAFRYRNELVSGLHLQRQGPDRSRAGQDRGRPDAAQGRHRRRRERPAGRRPQRRQARRRTELLARLRKGPRQI